MGIFPTPVASSALPTPASESFSRSWHAVFTVPQHEKSAARQLGFRSIESFLPTYESVRLWKNRQRVKLALPLFPSYLFVRINNHERGRVLQSPGVLRIIGNHRQPLPIPDETIDFLRSDLCARGIEPYSGLVIGQKVRICSGALKGVEGTLMRKNNHHRFVLTIDLINRHAAVEVAAENLEPIIEDIQ